MGRITDYIKAYKAGDVTLDELAETLAMFAYRPPTPDSEKPSDPWERMDWVDEHLFDDETDTWNEILTARAEGLLTSPEYYFIHARHDERQAAKEAGVDVKPFWTGDKWRAYP